MGHHHHGVENDKLTFKLFFSILLNLTITVAEIIGGLVSNSLSLLSDAIHNLSDTASMILSYISIKIGKKEKNYKHTFGFKRIEILSALVNAVSLLIICIFLLIHAYERFQKPEPINGKLMFIVAVIGLLGNLFSVFLLHKDSDHSLNIKSTYLHLLGDTFSSIGVIIGSLLIYYYKIVWIDPVITILVVLYIFKESFSIVKESIHILMQGTPSNINIPDLQIQIAKIEGILDAHHTHIWMLSDHEIFLETHIKVKNMLISETENITEKIKHTLFENFGITHITLQYEVNECEKLHLIKEK